MNLYWIVTKEEYSNVAEIEPTYAEYTCEFGKRAITFRFISPKDYIISPCLDGTLASLHQNQRLDKSHAAFIVFPANLLNLQARAVSSTLYYFLRVRGVCLLNDRIVGIKTLEWDKIGQMTLEAKAAVPILLFTMLGYHQIIPAIKRFIGSHAGEYIFKPNGTGMEFGVIKLGSSQTAISIGNLISALSVEYFMRPYLTDAYDVQFFFIAPRLAFVKFCKPHDKGYIGNVALGGEQTILTEQRFLADYGYLPYFEKMLHLFYDLMRQTGSVIFSIDWLINNDGFYFNEMATAETDLTKLPQEIRTFVFDQLTRIIHDNHVCE